MAELEKDFLTTMDLEGKLKNSPLLSEQEKAWLLVGREIKVVQVPNSYIRDLQDTMDALIELNGACREGKDADDISRMYFTLNVLKKAFIQMAKIDNRTI